MRALYGRGIKMVVFVAVTAMLLGQVLGQPVLLGYVRTASMEPALSPGDGFVAVPQAATGDPEPGDVIVYRAEQLNGGGLITHRVVRETERGYVTRGDANPFTDQSSGEPPVREPQIVAVALTVGNTPVAIPGLGTGVEAIRAAITRVFGGVSQSLLIGGVVAGTVLLLFGGSATSRGRRALSERTAGHEQGRGPLVGPREVVFLVGVVLIGTATASMVLPLGPTEYRVVSAESDVPGPQVIPAGEQESTTYQVPGGTFVPTRYHVTPASEGVEVANGSGIVQPRAAANVTVQLSAPPTIGSYRRYVSENRYPLVLPLPVVDALYRLHPLAPVVVVDSILALPVLLAMRVVTTRRRERGSPGAQSRQLLGGENG